MNECQLQTRIALARRPPGVDEKLKTHLTDLSDQSEFYASISSNRKGGKKDRVSDIPVRTSRFQRRREKEERER